MTFYLEGDNDVYDQKTLAANFALAHFHRRLAAGSLKAAGLVRDYFVTNYKKQ